VDSDVQSRPPRTRKAIHCHVGSRRSAWVPPPPSRSRDAAGAECDCRVRPQESTRTASGSSRPCAIIRRSPPPPCSPIRRGRVRVGASRRSWPSCGRGLKSRGHSPTVRFFDIQICVGSVSRESFVFRGDPPGRTLSVMLRQTRSLFKCGRRWRARYLVGRGPAVTPTLRSSSPVPSSATRNRCPITDFTVVPWGPFCALVRRVMFGGVRGISRPKLLRKRMRVALFNTGARSWLLAICFGLLVGTGAGGALCRGHQFLISPATIARSRRARQRIRSRAIGDNAFIDFCDVILIKSLLSATRQPPHHSTAASSFSNICATIARIANVTPQSISEGGGAHPLSLRVVRAGGVEAGRCQHARHSSQTLAVGGEHCPPDASAASPGRHFSSPDPLSSVLPTR